MKSGASLEFCVPSMRGLLPLLVGQTPSPENHAKLLFTTGIPSGLRSAYYISKYRSLSTYVLIYWYLFHVEPNLSLFHFHLT
jgi:hypothetical protein